MWDKWQSLLQQDRQCQRKLSVRKSRWHSNQVHPFQISNLGSLSSIIRMRRRPLNPKINHFPQKSRFVLRLFVARNASNSRIARENLQRLQEKYPGHEFVIEMVDVNLKPDTALEHGVFISPALQILETSTSGFVNGNLGEETV